MRSFLRTSAIEQFIEVFLCFVSLYPLSRGKDVEIMAKFRWRVSLLIPTLILLYVGYVSFKLVRGRWSCDKSQASKSTGSVASRGSVGCFSNRTKLILFYTPLFSSKPWNDIKSTADFLVDCPSKNCKISYDNSDIGRSDLAIFHAIDMPSWWDLQILYYSKCSFQRMAYLSHESVQLKPKNWAPNGFFDWTITYKRNSDFTIPYGHSFPKPAETTGEKASVNFAKGKDKLVAWAVSHCGTARDAYVKELVKHINVDVYGACSSVYGQDNQCLRNSSNCDALFKTYKFYLAFESFLCADYITEKFWRTLNWSVVPVVLMRDSYEAVAPPGSFISVQDFPTVKALAQYLLYLDKNDTAYNGYFKWRRKFGSEQKHWFRFVACDICDALQNECLQKKSYQHFESFWNQKADCDEREASLLRVVNAASNSLPPL